MGMSSASARLGYRLLILRASLVLFSQGSREEACKIRLDYGLKASSLILSPSSYAPPLPLSLFWHVPAHLSSGNARARARMHAYMHAFLCLLLCLSTSVCLSVYVFVPICFLSVCLIIRYCT